MIWSFRRTFVGLAASSIALGNLVLAFDYYARQMSPAAADFWHYDLYSADDIAIGRDMGLVAGIVVVTLAAAGFIYWAVHDTGDVINYSGIDLVRKVRGRDPKRSEPVLDMQQFSRSLFVGGWVGALLIMIYALMVRQIEVLAYGPIIGFVFGALIFPGVANVFWVNRRKAN